MRNIRQALKKKTKEQTGLERNESYAESLIKVTAFRLKIAVGYFLGYGMFARNSDESENIFKVFAVLFLFFNLSLIFFVIDRFILPPGHRHVK